MAHCKKENENQWKQEWGYKGYFSSHTDNSKGIAILMVGDWDVVQDYEIDTANYRSQNNIKAQQQIIDMKNSLDLIDIWRAINPDTKRYTWRGPDLKQSRHDYFLISSDFEPFVKKVDIEISYRSDHSPVCLALQFYNQTKGRGTWKFNNSLLHDKEYVSKVKKMYCRNS